MKRILASLLSCLLLLSLAACGGTEPQPPEPAEPAPEEAPGETGVPEEAPGESGDLPTPEAQLAVIAQNSGLWRVDELDYWAYAVTDLDQNGLLELTSTETHGTGHFTTTLVSQVQPDLSGMVPCPMAAEDAPFAMIPMAAGPDAELPFPVYRDEGSGELHYVLYDMVRTDALHYLESYLDCGLRDGTLTGRALAFKETAYEVIGETEEEIVTYTDADGAPITEEDFLNAGEQAFPDLTPMEAHLSWIECRDDLDTLDEAALTALLADSWAGFALTAAE